MSTTSAALPRLWLQRTASRRPALRRSGLVLAADALAGVGVAAGLAGAVAAIGHGLGEAAPWLVLIVLSGTARAALAALASALAARAAGDLKLEVRRDAVSVMLSRGRGDAGSTGETLALVVDGVEALDGYFTRFAPSRAASALAPMLILGAVALASPISAAILAFALAPFAAGMALAGLIAADEARRQFQALQRLSGLFVDRLRALPVIWTFEAAPAETERLAVRADELRRRTTKVLSAAFLSSAVMEFFAALSVALAAVYCGFNLLRLLPVHVPETLDLRRAVFVLALAPEVYAPLRRLAAAYHDRQAAEAVVPALAAQTAAGAASTPARTPVVVRPAPSIRFRDVSVVYADAAGPALEHLDLDIPAGQITAVLGASGAGKSTLLHLLLGLAPLSRGEVWIDGVALSQAGSFAPAIAWAGQSPLLVPGSIADNIRLACPAADGARVNEVAAAVGLQGALDRREAGLSAIIGERGGGLSGGETRRIGLARALLKPAPILLLDEPTANLDAAAAGQLLPVIRAAARGRTTIIATHSEAVAALADQVVRL